MLLVNGFLMVFLTIFIVFLMSLYRNKQKKNQIHRKKKSFNILIIASLTRNNRLFFNQNFLFIYKYTLFMRFAYI
jgi:hypothetical protein